MELAQKSSKQKKQLTNLKNNKREILQRLPKMWLFLINIHLLFYENVASSSNFKKM